jgi:hypothetical protein
MTSTPQGKPVWGLGPSGTPSIVPIGRWGTRIFPHPINGKGNILRLRHYTCEGLAQLPDPETTRDSGCRE